MLPTFDSWSGYQHGRFEFAGEPGSDCPDRPVGCPGFCAYVTRVMRIASWRRSSRRRPWSVRRRSTLSGLRQAIPVFGVDMTEDTIPLEAGIEARAISFTKGCYVGQES